MIPAKSNQKKHLIKNLKNFFTFRIWGIIDRVKNKVKLVIVLVVVLVVVTVN